MAEVEIRTGGNIHFRAGKDLLGFSTRSANMEVTPEGKIKILDFGLARALHDDTAIADQSYSWTITDEMTRLPSRPPQRNGSRQKASAKGRVF
jgi:hypothetical protein